MMTIAVYQADDDRAPKGKPDIVPLNKSACGIGRDDFNDIVLNDADVSPEHACITREKNNLFICDLHSDGGTYLGGYRIPAAKKIKFKTGSVIGIGAFCLKLAPNADKGVVPDRRDHGSGETGENHPTEKYDESREVIALKAEIHRKLLDIIELRRPDFKKTTDQELRRRCDKIVRATIADEYRAIMGRFDEEEIIKDILDEALGLGPLEDLIADEKVTEIMVNRPDLIYLEKSGKIIKSKKIFSNTKSVHRIIARIVGPLGRRIDESSPMVDARLKDGSRVNVVIPPLALDGPCLTIRKFTKIPLTVDDLIRYGSVSPAMVSFIKTCIVHRKNILISGGTGSGKTTALNVFSSFIPEQERVVTIEDAAELQLPQEHVIRLESRPPNIEGKGEITIRQLVKNALRMRPDRIIIGECRGGETLDMLQAMNTGHDGSITTVHANSPKDVVARLETMVLQAGSELSSRAIREQIASAMDIVIQQIRFGCGSRKITAISEIVGMQDDKMMLQDIFYFKPEGLDPKGKTVGSFLATGWIPEYYEALHKTGAALDMSIFHN
jgi:pilus assembly protein CpaF